MGQLGIWVVAWFRVVARAGFVAGAARCGRPTTLVVIGGASARGVGGVGAGVGGVGAGVGVGSVGAGDGGLGVGVGVGMEFITLHSSTMSADDVESDAMNATVSGSPMRAVTFSGVMDPPSFKPRSFMCTCRGMLAGSKMPVEGSAAMVVVLLSGLPGGASFLCVLVVL